MPGWHSYLKKHEQPKQYTDAQKQVLLMQAAQ
jgi:hypothetical protein